MNTLQIGVMGSAADLQYSEEIEQIATKLGTAIAKTGNILVFGAEKDCDSLSTVANRSAKKAGGITLGITYGKKTSVWDTPTILVATGMERGGGREFSLVLSCDVVICVGGGSGTLNEMLVAYQAGIPIIALENTGGWSEKLAGTYMDNRKRLKIESTTTPEAAVDLAMKLAKSQQP